MSTQQFGTSVAIATPDLEIIEGQITTTSMQVAQHFGKRHDNVLRAIRNLDCSEEFKLRNFEEVITQHKNGKGGTQEAPAYRLTRDGFVFLAMGFTGKDAALWKEAYISAFNRMEEELRKQATPALEYSRISPSQAQDIKSAVHRVAGKCKQTFAEVWGRLHNKFRVNSYLELPASRYEDVMDYLMDKLGIQHEQVAIEPDVYRFKGVASYFEVSVAAAAELSIVTRWMSNRDLDTGEIITRPIPNDCYVMNKQQIINAISNGAFLCGISNDDIFAAIDALQQGLKQRLEIERRNQEAMQKRMNEGFTEAFNEEDF